MNMDQNKVKITIKKDGTMKIDCENWQGMECHSVADLLTQMGGKISNMENKQEQFQIPVPDPVQAQVEEQ